jgi:hypothetical protein
MKSVRATAGLMLLLSAFAAHADSQLVGGAGSASADLNFRVVIGRVLFLAVGSGANTNPRANNGTVNRAIFNYTNNPGQVGTGAAAATITGANVRARVYGNNGQITITVTNPANLVSGSNTIPFSQITATSSAAAALPVPAMGGGSVNPALSAGGRITNQTAIWRFRYANTVTPAAGTYNGQVIYTASML